MIGGLGAGVLLGPPFGSSPGEPHGHRERQAPRAGPEPGPGLSDKGGQKEWTWGPGGGLWTTDTCLSLFGGGDL